MAKFFFGLLEWGVSEDLVLREQAFQELPGGLCPGKQIPPRVRGYRGCECTGIAPGYRQLWVQLNTATSELPGVLYTSEQSYQRGTDRYGYK
jgi:hypothetical protein